jgi:hypothetical protein
MMFSRGMKTPFLVCLGIVVFFASTPKVDRQMQAGVSEAYYLYLPISCDRPTWDLTATIYAIKYRSRPFLDGTKRAKSSLSTQTCPG